MAPPVRIEDWETEAIHDYGPLPEGTRLCTGYFAGRDVNRCHFLVPHEGAGWSEFCFKCCELRNIYPNGGHGCHGRHAENCARSKAWSSVNNDGQVLSQLMGRR